MVLPKNIEFIIDRLEKWGFEAYVVGGCVRDSIMGLKPHDWDVCTSATPEDIKEVFYDVHLIPTGIKHGTITLNINGENYEVTTYRIDGNYSDSRHPDSVEFTTDIVEDLSRRDFTMNAIAYNPSRGFVDPFNGVKDIEDEIINTVGNAHDRFHEDALRVLRAMRFCATLDFSLGNSILYEIENDSELKNLLAKVSKERINAELTKMLYAKNNDSIIFALGVFSDILSSTFPQFEYFDCLGVFNRNSFALSKPLSESNLRYALLFNTHNCEEIMRDFKFKNEIIKTVVNIRRYGTSLVVNYNGQKRYHVARRLLKDLTLQTALDAVDFAFRFRDYSHKETFEYLKKALVNVSNNPNECYKLSQLKVNGEDIEPFGFVGVQCGKMLNDLLEMVITEKVPNDREKLMEVVKKCSLTE